MQGWTINGRIIANNAAGRKKRATLLNRQLGYLVRPVAFRLCLSAGLALSLFFNITPQIINEEIVFGQWNSVVQGNKIITDQEESLPLLFP